MSPSLPLNFTNVDLVKVSTPYVESPTHDSFSCKPTSRIQEVNHKGPELRAVIETNPSALQQAASLDNERRRTGKHSIPHVSPVLVKDNMAAVVSEGTS
ncbi:hypothetical protein A0H81_13689 [Grifola frondosa]|uniref:Amidase domain-containing protein n=1 Tax=Grifola frondosa TaxID=5627 RepID=A0A1C7LR91_GRIFR|nr:hypothetical protein A0H81_13689 [Grifola frondosa]